jgi:hypothetical protein
VEPFGALPRGTRGLLAAEAEDVARFLDASASLEFVPAPR